MHADPKEEVSRQRKSALLSYILTHPCGCHNGLLSQPSLPYSSLCRLLEAYPMECPMKDGVLYVQHLKFGKKWRKVWAQLFPDSPSGVARLEYFDMREGVAAEKATLRKSERKVIRLSDCVSVQRAEEHSSPKDTTPFYLSMMERNILLAADQPNDWIECICQLAFQKTSSTPGTTGNTPCTLPQMEENTIYSSWQETCDFAVTVCQTEASARCHLKGNYQLVPLHEQLVLKDQQSGQALYTWPYTFLRRYGQEKTVFSFEAGRRCESGEGLFTFNTTRAAAISRAVSAAIDRQKVALLETDKKAGVSPVQDCTQKPGAWSWPNKIESMEETQVLHVRPPKEVGEVGVPVNDSSSVCPESEASETPIIYASIGKCSPALFQAWDKETEPPTEQGGPVSDHLYENLRALEQTALGCRDTPEGSSSSSTEPSPIYDNSPVVAKRSTIHPIEEAESSPESQRHLLLGTKGTESGEEGNARSKTRGAGAFKHKLVSILSREGGTPKVSSKNTGQGDKL